MPTKTKASCPMCSSHNVEIRRDVTAKYRYLRKNHELHGQEHTICLECGCSFFQPGQMDRNRQRFLDFAKTIVKGIAPWEIHEIREKYLISQDDANRIFNCGSKTQFSKWERGECAPTGTAALALREALENPTYMLKLAKRVGVAVDVPKQQRAVLTLRALSIGAGVYLPTEHKKKIVLPQAPENIKYSYEESSAVQWPLAHGYIHQEPAAAQ